MKLYTHPLSGHAHRVQLFLALAQVPYEAVQVDLASREHKSAGFLALNPFGQIPVLEDGEVVVPDSNAIMVYVARKLGLRQWYPEAPQEVAQVQRWFSLSAGPLAYGPAAARLVTVFGAELDAEAAIARAHQLFQVMEGILKDRLWLASQSHPTLADVALFSYTHHAPEGNVDLAPYPHIRAWLSRVRELPGFVPFQETPVGLRAV